VLEPKLWLEQRSLLRKAEALQAKIGTAQSDNFNAFDEVLKKPSKTRASNWKPKRKSNSLMR
jgi:type I restriction enzyme M protein